MWMQEEEDNNVVQGIVNDGLIYYHVNAAEPKAIKSNQNQLPLRVYLPHHELMSCLEEQVNPQWRENLLSICTNFKTGAVPQQKPHMMMSLCQQCGKSTTLSTSKLHHTGHGKMSVAVRACAWNERGSACNAHGSCACAWNMRVSLFIIIKYMVVLG